MKVVLRSDVENVGKKGDICEVANGFGRNFLIPKGQALLATKGVVSQAAAMRRARDAADVKGREEAQTLANSLRETTVIVEARAGAEGKLFGSITSADIAAALQKQTGVAIDRKRIDLQEHIKTAGDHMVPLKLHADVPAEIKVSVVTG